MIAFDLIDDLSDRGCIGGVYVSGTQGKRAGWARFFLLGVWRDGTDIRLKGWVWKEPTMTMTTKPGAKPRKDDKRPKPRLVYSGDPPPPPKPKPLPFPIRPDLYPK